MATTKSKQNKLDAFIDGQYQTLDPKVKFFILALCFLLPLILAYYLFYQPHTQEQERLKKEIEAVQADIRKLNERGLPEQFQPYHPRGHRPFSKRGVLSKIKTVFLLINF